MKLFSPRRLRRALIVYAILGAILFVLTVLERRRMASSATIPAAAAAGGPLDGRVLLIDVERLAGAPFAGRRTGTAGSGAAQEFMVERLRSLNAAPTFGESFRQPFSFTRRSIKGWFLPSRPYETHYPEAANVGAVIRGRSQPDRFVALTAHYDALGVQDGQLFPGADDNGSGIAVLLGVAGALGSEPPAHSVLLLAFDAEELGLRGSRHFVANSPVPLDRIDAVVNLDMVGRGDQNTLVAAGTSLYPALQAPVRAAAAERTLRVVFGHDRPIYAAGGVANWAHASDHGPFHDAGVPFVYLGVEDHSDQHQPTDTADRIDPRFLGEVGNLVLGLVRHLDATKTRQ